MAKEKVCRNQLCPCGSGRKFKHCCELKNQGMSLAMKLVLVAGAGLLIGAIAFGVSSFNPDPTADGRVWSQEHGHYH